MDHVVVQAARVVPESARQQAMRRIGNLLALLGAAFVTWRLHAYWNTRDVADFFKVDGLWLLALAIVCGLANVLLATAWHVLLGQTGVVPVLRWSVKTYGLSQLARYVPGNIFHLVGRQTLGIAAGLPARAMALSAIFELLSISAAGTLYVAMIMPLWMPRWHWMPGLVLFCFACTFVAFALGLRYGPRVVCAFSLHLLFLAISGGGFVLMLALVGGADGRSIDFWIGALGLYVVAWLVGLVTPGAPAGLGVREFVVITLLHGLVDEHVMLTAVVLQRLAGAMGDFLFYLLAWSIPMADCDKRVRT